MTEQMTAEAASTDPFDVLVDAHLASISCGPGGWQWRTIRDPRVTAPTYVTVKERFRKPRTEERWATVPVTLSMQKAYELLCNRRALMDTLTLPPDSPIPAQMDATFDQFLELADRLTVRDDSPSGAVTFPEHQRALTLAAQMAALVDLVEQRSAVVHNLDPESIRRTARALVADLNAARELLSGDRIDRELARAGM